MRTMVLSENIVSRAAMVLSSFSWLQVAGWAALCIVVAKLLRIREAWRFRSVPGPLALPLFGSTLSIALTRGGFLQWRRAMAARYGSMYKLWIGRRAAVIVCDPDFARTVAQASNDRVTKEQLNIMEGPVAGLEDNSLLGLSPERHGAKFRAIRRAYEAAVMSPVSLEGHEPYLLKSISRMLARVDRAAASGEPLNMVVHLANMTLDSVGFAAFGVDLHCQDLTPEREADLQRALSRSASMLRSGSLQRSLSRALTLNGSSMRRMASAMTPRSPIFSPRSPAPWESPRRRTRMGFNPPDAPVKPAGTEPLVPPKSPTTPPASQPPESPVKPPASQPAKLPFKAPAFQLPESPVNPPTSQPLVLEPEVQQDWMDMLGSREFGHGLVVALKNMIRLAEPQQGSPLKAVNLLWPGLNPLLRFVARYMPDRRFSEEVMARKQALAAVQHILDQWREYKEAEAVQDRSVPMPAVSDRGFLVRLYGIAEAEGLTDQDIMDQVLFMLLAGHETVASSLASALNFLTTNPEKMARLQHEVDSVLGGKTIRAADLEHMPYLEAVYSETLRLAAPLSSTGRTLHKDLTFSNGVKLPAGCGVGLDLDNLHYNPAIWPEPNKFLPERWLPGHEDFAPKTPLGYAPFGFSARKCPAFKFAILQARLALASIVQAFDCTPTPGKPKLEYTFGVLQGPSCLWLDFTRRSNARAHLMTHEE